jgi:hypothetical protein
MVLLSETPQQTHQVGVLKRKKFMNELLKFMGESLNESTVNHGNGNSNVATCILQYFSKSFKRSSEK